METDFYIHIITTKETMTIQHLCKKWDVCVAKPLELPKSQKNWCTHGNYIYVKLYNICALIQDIWI